MDHDKPYHTPQVTRLGTVEELTEAFNKVGSKSDSHTAAIEANEGITIVGSLVPSR